MEQTFWLLAVPGWLRVAFSDGALAVIACHVPQLAPLCPPGPRAA